MLLVALLLAAPPAGLSDLQQRLERERNTARQLAAREANLLGRLADLERQIEVEGRALRAAQVRLRAANERLKSAGEAQAQADGRLSAKTDALGPRLLARYKLGREGYLRFVLGARSIGEVLRRKHLFDLLLASDLAALAELEAAAKTARAARDEVAQAQAGLDATARAEEDRRESLEASVEQQRRVLLAVQEERAAHEEAVRELEEAGRRLSSKLGELSKESPSAAPAPHPEASSIRKARGKLLFPVSAGRVEVPFGRAVDRRFGTVTLQRGLDIRAPEGTAVYAVWAGKIAHAGWFKGYGNLLIVDHGEGIFSLMAHLGTLERAVGEAVRQGDQVGTVGDTGSLKGTYLYFELRDGQKPLDPGRWLSRNRKKPPAVVAGAKAANR